MYENINLKLNYVQYKNWYEIYDNLFVKYFLILIIKLYFNSNEFQR